MKQKFTLTLDEVNQLSNNRAQVDKPTFDSWWRVPTPIEEDFQRFVISH